eukprot:6198191-Pleurochrysis_carterae.AAC.2
MATMGSRKPAASDTCSRVVCGQPKRRERGGSDARENLGMRVQNARSADERALEGLQKQVRMFRTR